MPLNEWPTLENLRVAHAYIFYTRNTAGTRSRGLVSDVFPDLLILLIVVFFFLFLLDVLLLLRLLLLFGFLLPRTQSYFSTSPYAIHLPNASRLVVS